MRAWNIPLHRHDASMPLKRIQKPTDTYYAPDSRRLRTPHASYGLIQLGQDFILFSDGFQALLLCDPELLF